MRQGLGYMGSRSSVSGLGFWGSAGLAEFGNRKRIQVFGLATPDMACRVKGFLGAQNKLQEFGYTAVFG